MGNRRDHRCERANKAYKCSISEAVDLALYGHYALVCAVSKVIGINTEKYVCQTINTLVAIDKQ